MQMWGTTIFGDCWRWLKRNRHVHPEQLVLGVSLLIDIFDIGNLSKLQVVGIPLGTGDTDDLDGFSTLQDKSGIQ